MASRPQHLFWVLSATVQSELASNTTPEGVATEFTYVTWVPWECDEDDTTAAFRRRCGWVFRDQPDPGLVLSLSAQQVTKGNGGYQLCQGAECSVGSPAQSEDLNAIFRQRRSILYELELAVPERQKAH